MRTLRTVLSALVVALLLVGGLSTSAGAGSLPKRVIVDGSRLTDSGYLNTSPIGIFRQVERPTYDDQAREQVTAAVAEAGNGDTADRSARLASLIGGGDTWTIL